jgi:hypothetical protein
MVKQNMIVDILKTLGKVLKTIGAIVIWTVTAGLIVKILYIFFMVGWRIIPR